MANITTILGTDSLSSSRLILNSNFSALNDQLIGLATLLDADNSTLTVTGDIEASTLTIQNSGTDRFLVTSTTVVSELDTTIEGELIINNGLRKSVTGSAITTMPAANSYTLSTYLMDSASFSGGDVTVNAGDSGQEITLIADGGSVDLAVANISGATAITINQNGTITLRWVGTSWYIVSSFNSTITT